MPRNRLNGVMECSSAGVIGIKSCWEGFLSSRQLKRLVQQRDSIRQQGCVSLGGHRQPVPALSEQLLVLWGGLEKLAKTPALKTHTEALIPFPKYLCQSHYSKSPLSHPSL